MILTHRLPIRSSRLQSDQTHVLKPSLTEHSESHRVRLSRLGGDSDQPQLSGPV